MLLYAFGDHSSVGDVLVSNRARLSGQYSRNGQRIATESHKLHHKGLSSRVDMHNSADIARP